MVRHTTDYNDAEAIIGEAASLIEKKLYVEAISTLQRGVSADPNNPKVWENIAICNLEIGKPKIALQAINNLLKIQPQCHAGWADKGFLHILLNETEQGIDALQESLRINPRRVYGWELLGMVLVGEERWEEAIDVLERTLDLNPNSAVTWYNLAICYLLFDELEEAVQSAEVAFSIDPSLRELAEDWWDLVQDDFIDDDMTSMSRKSAS
ncbi:MAG: tetratricopeptide repeat protein [Candidatus Thorarchaeota archaeon]